MHTTTLKHLQSLLSDVTFTPGNTFCWSPNSRKITYPTDALAYDDGAWALLHEAGHALLDHQLYVTDFELLRMEVAAWEKAKQLSQELDIVISDEHVQDCLDTYRDWLHKRSTCPTCGSVSLQHNGSSYACHNCPAQWQVTAARFCRPYRLLKRSTKDITPKATSAVFQ